MLYHIIFYCIISYYIILYYTILPFLHFLLLLFIFLFPQCYLILGLLDALPLQRGTHKQLILPQTASRPLPAWRNFALERNPGSAALRRRVPRLLRPGAFVLRGGGGGRFSLPKAAFRGDGHFSLPKAAFLRLQTGRAGSPRQAEVRQLLLQNCRFCPQNCSFSKSTFCSKNGVCSKKRFLPPKCFPLLPGSRPPDAPE